MSGYMAAQALLKTKLLTCASFGASDVTEGDYRVMDSGSTNMAIIIPGNIPLLDVAGMTRTQEYDAIVDLITKFVDDTSYNTFGTLRDAMLAVFIASPALSADYFITEISTDADIQELFDRQGAGPFFVSQRFRFTIQEQV